MRSSFASFNTGLLGMRASQYALDITGHNVVNIGTGGYTRQRIDQYSLSLYGGSGSWDAKMGQGVMVSGVSQIRDPYLDVRFRNEIAQVGYSDSTLQGLKDLESIINEVGVGTGIATQFEELSKAMSKLASEPNNSELENIVRSAVDTLTKFMNQYAKKVEIAQGETETNFTEKSVPEINALMKSISDLNVSIEKNQMNGNPALELLDQRNVMIDQLAQHVKIDVQYKQVKIPGTERTIEQLNINYVDNNGKKIPLIEGTGDPGEFTAVKDPVTGKMDLSLQPSNPKLPSLGLGGYPPVAQDKLGGLNDLLKKIADGNTATTDNASAIATQEGVLKTQWNTILVARRNLAGATADQKDAMQQALTAAEDAYTDTNKGLDTLKATRTQLQEARQPTLEAIQKLLPNARFNEVGGNMKISFNYAGTNHSLVDADKSAVFSVGGTATGTTSATLQLQALGVTDTQALGTYPHIPKDKAQDINNLLKNMELLERGQTENTPPLLSQADLETERQKLVDKLNTYLPAGAKVSANVNADINAIPPTTFKVTYQQGGENYSLIEGDLPAGSFYVSNNALMIDRANPPEASTTGLFKDMAESSFRGTLELLNCEGSFNNTKPNEPRGYGYYTKMLDTLAVTMANAFNDANKPMTDKNGKTIGGDMFGSSEIDPNDPTKREPITAKNICVAEGWARGDYGLVADRDPTNTDKAENLLYMETLLTSNKTTFLKNPNGVPGAPPGAGDIAFTGTFRECFVNMHGMLGTDIKTTSAVLKNHLTVAGDISDSIDSVSSVSLDEEGVNMMHYQKSLNASIRFMTTIDEALNTIINNMGVVGR